MIYVVTVSNLFFHRAGLWSQESSTLSVPQRFSICRVAITHVLVDLHPVSFGRIR
jgi:hypothetical protein